MADIIQLKFITNDLLKLPILVVLLDRVFLGWFDPSLSR